MDRISIISWIVILLIVISIIGYVYGKRRGEAFQKFARQMGLSFSKKVDMNALAEFNDFQLFSAKRGKTFSYLISGEMESASVMLFDYRFKTLEGHLSDVYSQTVALVKSSRLNFPAFEMYPQGALHKMFSVLGKQDINFQHQQGFSNAYILRSEGENAVRSIFTDQVLSYFENHRGLTIEAKDDKLIYYRDGKLIKPDHMNSFLSDVLDLVRLFD
jgi:hypothetical protein